jgi:hypothetical protein
MFLRNRRFQAFWGHAVAGRSNLRSVWRAGNGSSVLTSTASAGWRWLRGGPRILTQRRQCGAETGLVGPPGRAGHARLGEWLRPDNARTYPVGWGFDLCRLDCRICADCRTSEGGQGALAAFAAAGSQRREGSVKACTSDSPKMAAGAPYPSPPHDMWQTPREGLKDLRLQTLRNRHDLEGK